MSYDIEAKAQELREFHHDGEETSCCCDADYVKALREAMADGERRGIEELHKAAIALNHARRLVITEKTGCEAQRQRAEKAESSNNELMANWDDMKIKLAYTEAKLSAYESAGPEDEETITALKWCEMGDERSTIVRQPAQRIANALRAAWVRIRELEKKA